MLESKCTLPTANFPMPSPFPSKVTRASLLNGDDVIINAETGCGKTLAFLTPLVDALYRDHFGDGVGGMESGPATGLSATGRDTALTTVVKRRGLVLAPTTELAIQIRSVFDLLAAPLGVDGACPFSPLSSRFVD